MLVFAFGTLPALLSLSALSSFAAGNVRGYFLKVAGAAVIVLGLLNIQYGLVLTGSSVDFASMNRAAEPAGQSRLGGVVIAGDKQIANMKVVGLDYQPNRFAVTKGVPVEWRIDASEAEGCGRVLVIPKLRMSRLLSRSEPTIITFTPEETGDIAFNCGMGMMTPGSKFVVTASAKG